MKRLPTLPSLVAAAISLVLILSPSTASAQSSKGILFGTVRDKSGAVVPGVKVAVTSEDTGETRSLTTSGQGAYRADGINPGLYEIRVEGAGFEKLDVKDIRVAPSVVTSYDPSLAVASAAATVTIEADSNLINTDNGQLSGTIDQRELASVPIFTMNPIELVATLPGVQLVNQTSLNLGGVGGNFDQIIVNGARPRSNNFMLDSQDINDVGIGGQSFDLQLPDMYQTTTALLNSASAEYGRSGGAVVNNVTKSGTNHFHGTAFELYEGSGLDAIDGVTREGKPFAAGTNPKARYDQHQYGFTAGGPLWKNKLFAFGGTSFRRFYGTTSSGSLYLPNAAGYAILSSIAASSNADKSQAALLEALLDGGSYLTAYTDLSTSNPTNVGKPQKISAANCPNGLATCPVPEDVYQRPPVAEQNPDTQWIYRIDFIPVSTDTFTFRYLHDRQNTTPDTALNTSGLPGFDGEVGGPAELAEGTWTHVFTPNVINELRASEVRLSDLFTTTPDSAANPVSKNYNVSLTGSNINALGLSQNIPQGRTQELYQFQDTVSWTIGRQSLRMGADIGRDLEKDLVPQMPYGSLSFSAGGGLSSLDNFLSNTLGTAGSATKSVGPTRLDPHLWKSDGFVQDDIKLSSELTLNLGVRYDFDTNPENVLPYPAVSLSNPFAPIATEISIAPDYNNFAPRIGFAFNPHGGIFADGKTVFHGGFGIFYDVDFTNIVLNTAVSAPNSVSVLLNSTPTAPISNPAAALAAAPAVISSSSSVSSVASNLVNPVTYQYNLGIERQLPAQVQLAVNYVGARANKLFANQQLNPFVNGARINSGRNAINVRDNGGDSNYNSAQVEVSRRFVQGFFFRASYTFQKALDDSSEVFALFSNINTSYQANLQRLAQDYGESAWDRRHIASFEYVYEPKGFHSNSAAADALLETFTRHFILSGTTQFASGPFTDAQIIGIDTNNDVNPVNDRPLVGNPNVSIQHVGIDGIYLGATPGVYYDLAINNQTNANVVVQPNQVRYLIPYGPQYTTQEVGRDSYENPGQSFWNAAIEKDIPVSKLTHLENGMFVARVECENVGNHNNVGIVDTNLLDVGTPAFLDKSAARESTYQHFRLWAKFIF